MKRHNVLLVDDDPNLLRGVCRALRGQPFQLLTVRSADEALAIIKSRPIGVVVCDERMPGLSGAALCAWVAEHCPEVVRIMLTGHTSAETVARAVNDGRVFRFFGKPTAAVDLAQAIREGLELYEAAIGWEPVSIGA